MWRLAVGPSGHSHKARGEGDVETWVPVFLWPRPESPGPLLTGKLRRGSGTPCDGHWSHLYWGRRILIVSVQGLGMVNKFP